MKIAIFHDYLSAIGGGDRVVLTLARELGADIITTDVNMDSISKMGFDNVRIISLGETIKMPVLKQISACFKFATCDFSKKYDFFIFSNNWAHFASKKHKPNLLYCQSAPVRVFYDFYDLYLDQLSFFSSILFKIWVTFHRKFYEWYMKDVCLIVANSTGAQKRVKKYLNRNSIVIYPPINTKKFKFKEYGDFWLSVNRLYPEKRLELQIEAFRKLPGERLQIVGGNAKADNSSQYADNLIKDLPENVKLIGNVTEEELIGLYSRCKAFIITSIDEPFGMAPVEAMASGKAVVGMREGGCLETVIDGSTGLLVKPDVLEIVNAVKIISSEPSKYKAQCLEQARKFDEDIFLGRIRHEINEIISNRKSRK